MLPTEARWIMTAVQSLPSGSLSPLLDLGSSTKEFRERDQPWISEHVLSPLDARGVHVVHMDLVRKPGVDIVGDLLSDEIFATVSRLGIRSILCSNVLEHVEQREALCARMLDLVPPDGYVIVTVPFRYPYHPDPVDTLFRPDVAGLHRLFPRTRIVRQTILDCGFYALRGRPSRSMAIHLARLLSPFRKSSEWYEMLKWSFRKIAITCLLLQKHA